MHKVLFAAVALVLAACGDNGLSGGSCDSHTTAADCTADAACKVSGCAGCTQGETSFNACVAKDANPVVLCPAIACKPPCQTHQDAASCKGDPTCEVSGCSDCQGGQTFNGCYEKGAGPDLVCPAACPFDCAQNTDEASCNVASACHAVFENKSTACACAQPGCCTTFSTCANGAAICVAPSAPPCFAPPPVCEGDFVVSYGSACPEGCVRKSECS